MSMSLDVAKKKLDQARARYDKARALERQRQRKLDARQKIIIGGAVLALLRAQTPEFQRGLIRHLQAHLSEKDAAVVSQLLEQIARSGGSEGK